MIQAAERAPRLCMSSTARVYQRRSDAHEGCEIQSADLRDPSTDDEIGRGCRRGETRLDLVPHRAPRRSEIGNSTCFGVRESKRLESAAGLRGIQLDEEERDAGEPAKVLRFAGRAWNAIERDDR